MSILTREDLQARITGGALSFDPPLDEFQLQGHTIDLRLGFTFLVPRQWQVTAHGREALIFDPLEGGHQHFDAIELEPGQYFELLPGERVLVSTLERIVVPNDLSAVLYPRSSVNRQGLEVQLTGIIDAGYEGALIVPIRNSNPDLHRAHLSRPALLPDRVHDADARDHAAAEPLPQEGCHRGRAAGARCGRGATHSLRANRRAKAALHGRR